MTDTALTAPHGPLVHAAGSDRSALAAHVAAATGSCPGLVVRRVDGARARTQDAFFAELARALSFPDHFGANWHAVDDMITDLGWLPAPAYLLIVTETDELMADAIPESRQAVFTTLARGAADWPVRTPPVPFHVLYLARDPGALVAEQRALGVEAELLEG